jgi:hypothetical protein
MIKLFMFGVLSILTATSCKEVHQNRMTKLTGMWKLDKYESFDSISGRWHNARNSLDDSGYILYDGKGHMGVQLLPPGIKSINNIDHIDSLSNEDSKKYLKLYSTSFAYFANCIVIQESNLIEHNIVSSNNQEDSGTTLKRNFKFNGDTLILTANELTRGFKVRLRWTRI